MTERTSHLYKSFIPPEEVAAMREANKRLRQELERKREEWASKLRFFTNEQVSMLQELGFTFFAPPSNKSLIDISKGEISGTGERCMNLQIAVNPNFVYLNGSANRTFPEQEKLVRSFEKELKKLVPGIGCVMGGASDYMYLMQQYSKETGKSLLVIDGVGIRTNTTYTNYTEKVDYNYIIYEDRHGVCKFGNIRCETKDPYLFAFPLVVPRLNPQTGEPFTPTESLIQSIRDTFFP